MFTRIKLSKSFRPSIFFSLKKEALVTGAASSDELLLKLTLVLKVTLDAEDTLSVLPEIFQQTNKTMQK